MSIRIVCDSLSDIQPEVAQAHDIRVVSLMVSIEGEWVPETSLTHDAFWAAADAGNMPATSQPPVGAFSEVFEELVGAGHEVICLTMTAEHSGTFNSASVAALEFEGKVHVVDSRSLSYAEALQAVMAAEMAAEGDSVQEIIAALKDVQQRLHVRLMIDKLEWGRRGGRLAHVLAGLERISSVLKVKPLASVTDGHIRFAGIARSRKSALARLRSGARDLGEIEMILVAHARRPVQSRALADALAGDLGMDPADVGVVDAGPGLVSHTGEGMIAVCALPVSQRVRRRIWDRLPI